MGKQEKIKTWTLLALFAYVVTNFVCHEIDMQRLHEAHIQAVEDVIRLEFYGAHIISKTGPARHKAALQKEQELWERIQNEPCERMFTAVFYPRVKV